MGEVWLAEQTRPFYRRVALKLVKTGMDSRAVFSRFDSERQALALMEHPNIAKVFDAASAPDGRPYFVMEYVPGLPITTYCDKSRLTIGERLRLFTQVCQGVQHAHQKAIIHRDLKPSNILVQVQDDKPVPKIIDFGLAKAVAHRLTNDTMLTQMGTIVGTPAYMSPEQSDLSDQNVDTRTDVYSLGVILYELLVGALPLGTHEIREAGLAAMLQKIRVAEPPRPSTKVRSLGEDSKDSAERRHEHPKSLEKHLRGDLDWITMRALEKEKARRYGSPADLASDIERHLRNEPVLAGPPSVTYRAKKFVIRHKLAVSLAAVAAISILTFALTMLLQAKRIARERDRANLESETSRQVSEFMTGIFSLSDPANSKGATMTAREVLDRSAKEISTGLAGQPGLQARLMFTMADAYSGLGLYPETERLANEAVEIGKKALGPDHPETLRAQRLLGWTLMREGRNAEAEKLLLATIQSQRRVLGEEDEGTLSSINALSTVYFNEGRYSESDQVASEALRISQRAHGEQSKITLRLFHSLAVAYDGERMYDKEAEVWRHLVMIRQKTLGLDHPDTFGTIQNLGYALRRQGKYAEAEVEIRRSLEVSNRVLGPEHPSTLITRDNLANVMMEQKHFAEAETMFRDTLAARRRVLGEMNPETLYSINNLSILLSQEGKPDEAEKLEFEALEKEKKVLGPNHPEIGGLYMNLAGFEAQKKHREKSMDYLREALNHGYANYEELMTDTNLSVYRDDPEFQSIAKQILARDPTRK
jgi:non-specific serine/threonine protein kinase/serine/threonine-protein kinase